MKKLYFIGIVFEKEIREGIKALKVEAREKFGSGWALRSEAHITLVAPFHYDNEGIDKVVEKVSGLEVGKFEIGLGGIDRFDKRVIFVKVDKHEELLAYKEELDKRLEEFEIKSRSKSFHPHVTIAFQDLAEERFDEAYKYYRKKTMLYRSREWRVEVFENYESGWKVVN